MQDHHHTVQLQHAIYTVVLQLCNVYLYMHNSVHVSVYYT